MPKTRYVAAFISTVCFAQPFDEKIEFSVPYARTRAHGYETPGSAPSLSSGGCRDPKGRSAGIRRDAFQSAPDGDRGAGGEEESRERAADIAHYRRARSGHRDTMATPRPSGMWSPGGGEQVS